MTVNLLRTFNEGIEAFLGLPKLPERGEPKVLKVLRTFGEKTEQGGDTFSGDYPIYPKGTRRIALVKPRFFSRYVEARDGEKRRGTQIVEQEADVETIANDDSYVTTDFWYTVRFVDPKSVSIPHASP